MVKNENKQLSLYQLERLANKEPSKFVSIVSELIFANRIDDALNHIKRSGFLFNIYSGLKKANWVRIQNVLTDYSTNEKIKQFVTEVEIIYSLYEEFNLIKARSFSKLNSTETQTAMILTLEIASGGSSSIFYHKDSKWLETRYPFVSVINEAIRSYPLGDSGSQALINNMLAEYDHHLVMSKFPAMEIFYKKQLNLNPTLEISSQTLTDTLNWLNLVHDWNHIYHVVELWSYLNSRIVKKSNVISISIMQKDKFNNWMMSNLRHRAWRDGYHIGLMNKIESERPDVYSMLVDDDELSQKLYFSNFLTEIFYTKDFSEEIQGISIEKWLTAYICFKKISKQKLLSNDGNRKLRLKDWCIIRTHQEWISFLCENGLEQKDAQVIFKYLVFNEKTDKIPTGDLLDRFIVKCTDGYALLPSFSSMCDPGTSIPSNFKGEEELTFKGYNFEKFIMKSLKNAGLYPIKYKMNKNKREKHEYDIIFKLNECLFFIECKCYTQPYTFKRHQASNDILKEDIYKFNNHCDYMLNNLNRINRKLNLDPEWTPAQHKRIVVLSHRINSPLNIDNVLITDSFILSQILFGRNLRKNYPDISIKDLIHIGAYTSAEQTLIKGIQEPFALASTDKKTRERTISRQLELSTIEFNILELTESDFILTVED